MLNARCVDILVVEDESALRGLLQIVLQRSGYDVMLAENGRVAADFLAGGGATRLILLDMMMPVMDGLRFLAWLRENPAHIENTKIIVLSACEFGNDLNHSVHYLENVSAFVNKPVVVAELLEVIRRTLHTDA